MSTSKHIDKICIAVVVMMLILTGLFMNGTKLGLSVLTDETSEDGMFTDNDRLADWDTTDATRITLSENGATVSGNGAYTEGGDVYIVYAGRYVLSGSLTNGSVIVSADGDDKVWLRLDGVDIHCDDGAAIRVEQADKVFLTLADGTENTLSGGDTVDETADGVLFSRDDVTINGSGALTVTATAEEQHGIVCNDTLTVCGGTLTVTSKEDGLHANDGVKLADVTLSVSAGDDGIHVGNDDETAIFYMQSGCVTVTQCYEGIEANAITLAGGDVTVTSTDDGLNACGRGENASVTIGGGTLTILNPNGNDADGIDSNGDLFVTGGKVFISVVDGGSNSALDYGSENGGVCEISGGTVVACGGSGMAEGFDSTSTQAFVMTTVSGSADTSLTLTDGDGNTLIDTTVPYAFSSVVLSTPAMTVGDTVTLAVGGTSTDITVDNTTTGSAMGGGFGGMGGGNRGGGGQQPGGDTSMPEMPSDGGVNPGEQEGNTSMPEMPSGDMGGGPMPNGDNNGGTPPERPEGDTSMPEMPSDGGFNPGGQEGETSMPEMPSDGGFNPGGQEGDTSVPEKPNDESGGRGGGQMPNGDQSDREALREQETDNTAETTMTQNEIGEALILVGGSLLVLLVGLIIVIRKK